MNRITYVCALALASLLPISAFGQNGEDREIGGKKLKQWIHEARTHPDPGVRETAIRTLIFYGKDGRKAGKALILELKDPDPSLRSNAAVAIAAIGLDKEDVEEGVKRLGAIVQSDNQAAVRVQAAMALATFGPDAKAAIPQLAAVFRDGQASWEVRRAAAVTLGAVALDPKDGPSPVAITALTGVVRSDQCAKVKLHALTSLILLGKGPPAADGDPDKAALRKAQADAARNEKAVLENAAKDVDKLIALWARVALMRIEKVTEEHLIQIGLMLRSTELPHRINAAQALGAMGSEAKSQVPKLVAALRDTEPAAAAAAATALGGMGDDAQSAVPVLQELVAGKDEIVKLAAKDALARISKTDAKDMKKPAGK